MKQLDKIINQCRTAINAGIPIIYIESDDIGLLDDLLLTGKIAPFWHQDIDNGWVMSTSESIDNIWINNQLGQNFGLTGKYKAKDKLITANSSNILDFKSPVRFVIAVRNFSPTKGNVYDEGFANKLVKHVTDVVSSNPDDPIRKCTIIVQSSIAEIPRGIEEYVELIEVPKLEDEEIRDIIIDSANQYGEMPYEKLLQPLIVNLRGFNQRKILDILSRIRLNFGTLFCPQSETDGIALIRSVKEQMLKKEGLLTQKKVEKNASVSGLEKLSEWLNNRKELFDDPIKAKEQWNLSSPKGILVSGVPGTGKSALANEIGKVFDLPLLMFDMGSILGKYSGESDRNMRRALRLAESMSPCILWIDEIEKAFDSASSSGDSDGGQGKRLFGHFLTWMQEKKVACFIFATANDISKLPPEFLRRGRFDQKFYTFMPTKDDCVAIFKSKFEQYNDGLQYFRNILSDSNLKSKLAQLVEFCGSNGKFVTGADIEGIVKDAMFFYYKDYWRGKTQSTAAYNSEIFFEELKCAIMEAQTYGETDLDKIAKCLLLLAKNQFMSASISTNLINLKDVNFRNLSIPDFKGVNNGYDELLYKKVKDEIAYQKELGYNPETSKYDKNWR